MSEVTEMCCDLSTTPVDNIASPSAVAGAERAYAKCDCEPRDALNWPGPLRVVRVAGAKILGCDLLEEFSEAIDLVFLTVFLDLDTRLVEEAAVSEHR